MGPTGLPRSVAGLAALGALALGVPETVAPQKKPVPVYGYRVVKTYPHDPEAFTQGLVYVDGVLYEGTGLNGRSTLRKVDLTTGRVLKQIELAREYFGEGIAVYKDKIFQLTWRSNVGFVYRKDTLDLWRRVSYTTEGWGLTHDGTRLIQSDGSATLYFRNPDTFEEVGRLDVKDGARPLLALNELEWIQGEIYANVWQTDRVARIAPDTGRVLAWIDLSGLLSPAEREAADVLNGIAHDAGRNRIFVTGKLWPKLFEIQIQSK